MNNKEQLKYWRDEALKFEKLYYEAAAKDWMTGVINAKCAQQLYKKVGKKYVQVNDPWASDGLREGWWLVGVRPGSTSIRQAVHPDKVALQAAALDLEEKLIDIIRKASEAKPSKRSLSPAEKRDWDRLIKDHGDVFSTLMYPSFQQNAEEIIKTLTDRFYKNV
jgi:hypothetical protein